MSEFPEEVLSDLLRNATVITAAAAAIQLGDEIPDGHVRKITRIHVPSDLAPADREVNIFLGSTNDPALAANQLDTIVVAGGNPDHNERTDNLRAPVYNVRPDETPADDDDVLDKIYIQRVGAIDVRVNITFYDERA